MAASRQVFLCYARADDEPFVERVRDALVARGIDVWWDRAAMESRGRTFLQEIRDAIEQCERVLPVIGPMALASVVVGYEWAHALLYSRAVLPLLRLGRYEDVPAAFALFHTVDCRAERAEAEAIEELCRLLATPVPPLATLRRVPPLPPHFLPRAEHLSALGLSLLADVRTPAAVAGARQITVLRGMGGTGKSVLAAAFSRSRELRLAAPDGVTWLRAGRDADAESLLRSALHLLGNAPPPGGAAELTDRLAERFARAADLLVLDDAWSLAVVEPFRHALGPRTRLLVTTRDTGLAPSLGATEIAVDELDEVSALALLELCGGWRQGETPAEAGAIVAETGRLPLALAMVGALLRQFPDRASSYLARFRQARVDRIEAQLPDYPYPNLARVIGVSLEALPAQVQRCFVDLAILPDPPRAPRAVLEGWWINEGMDSLDAEDALDLLTARSLVRRDAPGIVSLHDLSVDYARQAHPDLLGAHRRLVVSYERRCEAGFASGPNDGYFFQNLGHHLEQSRRIPELLGLLLDSPAWLSAKLLAVRPDAAGLDDLALAARHPTTPEQEAALAMAGCVFRSLGRLWSDDDLETLVRLGRAQEAIQAAALRSQNPGSGYLRLTAVLLGEDRDLAEAMLERAEESARLTGVSGFDRVTQLTDVSRRWRELGDDRRGDAVLTEARELALGLAEAEERERAVWAAVGVVSELIRLGRDPVAREVATVLADEHATLWANMAAALAARGDHAAAQEILQGQLAAQPRAVHVGHLARLASAAPGGAARARWLEEGLAAWGDVSDPEERFLGAQALLLPAHVDGHMAAAELRRVISEYPLAHGFLATLSTPSAVQTLALFGGLAQAEALAGAVSSVSVRSEARLRIVEASLAADRIEDALALASRLETLGEKGDAASLVARALARRGDARAAQWLDRARALRLEGHARIDMFSAAQCIAEAFQDRDPQRARRVLVWVAERVRALPPGFDFSQPLADQARACLLAGLTAEAGEARARISNRLVLQDLFAQLAQDMACRGRLDEAQALVERMDPGWHQEAARAEVWINARRPREAVPAIEAVSRDYNRATLLARLAVLVHAEDPTAAEAIFDRAEGIARTLEDDMFAEELRQEVLGEVVRARLDCAQPERAWRIIEAMVPARTKFQAALTYVERTAAGDREGVLARLGEIYGAMALDGEQRQAMLHELAQTLVRLDLHADARSVLAELSATDRTAESQVRRARLHAEMGDFAGACREIVMESVDLFAGAVASWIPHYERIEPGRGARVLAELTRVAGWFRNDWREVRQILISPPAVDPSPGGQNSSGQTGNGKSARGGGSD